MLACALLSGCALFRDQKPEGVVVKPAEWRPQFDAAMAECKRRTGYEWTGRYLTVRIHAAHHYAYSYTLRKEVGVLASGAVCEFSGDGESASIEGATQRDGGLDQEFLVHDCAHAAGASNHVPYSEQVKWRDRLIGWDPQGK